MDLDWQIICHCVSHDCSKCPMRKTGTSGVLAERALLTGGWSSKEKSIPIIVNDEPMTHI